MGTAYFPQFLNSPSVISFCLEHHLYQEVRFEFKQFQQNSIGFQQNFDRFYDGIRFNLESRIADLDKYGDN